MPSAAGPWRAEGVVEGVGTLHRAHRQTRPMVEANRPGAVPDAVEPALDVAQRSLHGLRIPRKGAGGMAGCEAEHDDDEQRGSAGANHRLGSWVFGSAKVAG